MSSASHIELEKDLRLSHFSIENLHEGVFWIDSEAHIFNANEMACRMCGYSKEELVTMTVHDLNPTPVVADFPAFWKKLKKEKKLTFEAKHKHKTGYLYDVEITGNYIELEGREFTCSIVRDLQKKKMEEQLLRTVSEATSGLTGKDFLIGLTKNITTILGMKYSFISECADEKKSRLRTIAFVEGEKILDNIEYNTDDSACRMMMSGDPFFIPKGAHEFFPAAAGTEAYVGAPIISPSTGEIIGHVAATHPEPVTEEKNLTSVLKIFAARIGAELERIKAEDKLEQKNEELQQRLNEIELYQTTLQKVRDQIFWLDSNGRFIRVNEAVCEQSGYTGEEILQMEVFDLNPSLSKKEWRERWENTKKMGQEILETEHQHKNGEFYPVEVTNNYIVHHGKEYFCSLVRDIRKRKLEEELLRTISERTAAVTGEDYFLELTKFVTASLNVRYSMVVECSNEESTRLRMLSYVERQEVLENVEYDKRGTPCEIVMEGKDFFCENGLEKTFPKEKGIQSWVAVPIYSPKTGKVIGNIAAFDKLPMVRAQNQTAILKIFAARAGAEMERLKAEKELEKAYQELNDDLRLQLKDSEKSFRDLFDEAPIAYVHEGLDTKFLSANRAALKILGVKPEEVPDTYGSSLVPDTPEAQKRLREAFESVGRGTDTSGVVLELRRKDNGKPIWIQWWSNPVPGGQYTRTMFVDITDKVIMEKEKVRLQAENKYLQEEIKLNNNFDNIVSSSKSFQKILWQVEQVAGTDSTVLVLGESGTGKELIARAIHSLSKRSNRPLVKVNCAALPANLIESELFGHEKGAFTGATDKKIGRFELADGGTIFLDEIGEMPVDLQAKLLRVLQEGEFERLGNAKTIKVDVRIIAATNRKLDEAIESKEFREDLYYRLNVFPIITIPLRDRIEDIPVLVQHFCKKYESKIGKTIKNIPAATINALTAYHWPGNVRELENIIERALIVTPGNSLEPGDWIPRKKDTAGVADSAAKSLEDVEREHIRAVLEQTNWRVSGEKGAAKILGLNPTTLEARMKKLGIKKEK